MDPRFIEACKADGQKIERLIQQFYSHQPQRSVFIDGGAHVGYHTFHARQCFSHAVIAVEASPKTFVKHLISNVIKVLIDLSAPRSR